MIRLYQTKYHIEHLTLKKKIKLKIMMWGSFFACLFFTLSHLRSCNVEKRVAPQGSGRHR